MIPREVLAGRDWELPWDEFFLCLGIDPDAPITAEELEEHPVIDCLGMRALGGARILGEVRWRWGWQTGAIEAFWNIEGGVSGRGPDRHEAALQALATFWEMEWLRAGGHYLRTPARRAAQAP